MDRENGGILDGAISEQHSDQKNSSLHSDSEGDIGGGSAFIASSLGRLELGILGTKGEVFSAHGVPPTEMQRENLKSESAWRQSYEENSDKNENHQGGKGHERPKDTLNADIRAVSPNAPESSDSEDSDLEDSDSELEEDIFDQGSQNDDGK